MVLPSRRLHSIIDTIGEVVNVTLPNKLRNRRAHRLDVAKARRHRMVAIAEAKSDLAIKHGCQLLERQSCLLEAPKINFHFRARHHLQGQCQIDLD